MYISGCAAGRADCEGWNPACSVEPADHCAAAAKAKPPPAIRLQNQGPGRLTKHRCIQACREGSPRQGCLLSQARRLIEEVGVNRTKSAHRDCDLQNRNSYNYQSWSVDNNKSKDFGFESLQFLDEVQNFPLRQQPTSCDYRRLTRARFPIQANNVAPFMQNSQQNKDTSNKRNRACVDKRIKNLDLPTQVGIENRKNRSQDHNHIGCNQTSSSNDQGRGRLLASEGMLKT